MAKSLSVLPMEMFCQEETAGMSHALELLKDWPFPRSVNLPIFPIYRFIFTTEPNAYDLLIKTSRPPAGLEGIPVKNLAGSHGVGMPNSPRCKRFPKFSPFSFPLTALDAVVTHPQSIAKTDRYYVLGNKGKPTKVSLWSAILCLQKQSIRF